ncbi:MAG: C_GCAxxG_C_C family protein [Clostridia bacterium]|nr:C_GCAxxG_C_C family protein [Clostridia bacterium]
MTRKEKAMELFESGYNCSQSVVLAFSDMTGVDEKLLAKLSSSFGGGMGRLREVCGAVTGMFIVAGLLYGYEDAETGEKKAEHYARIQKLASRFSEETGTIICRELLGLDKKKDSPTPEKRTAKYYEERPCRRLVGLAAEILEEMIKENE